MQIIRNLVRQIAYGLLIFTGFLPVLHGQEPEIPVLKRIVIEYDSILYHHGDNELPPAGVRIAYRFNNILVELDPPPEPEMDTGSEKLYYAFRLEGLDNDWSMWSEYPVKEYTSLWAGNYRLRVRYGKEGVISGEEYLFSFRIERPFYLNTFFIILYSLVIVFGLIFIYRIFIHRHIREQERLERVIAERTEELMAEKEKTDNLLANLLPKGMADELMEKGKTQREKFNFVTVLFSDIQGFTRIAEEVNPDVLIDELDKFFFQFDNVVGKYNIEKIKTIGDAYMCAGGIPIRNRTNPVEVTLAALEMQQYMIDMKEDQRKRGLIFWDIRVGIHTGTVIAGVVGQKKLSYDIWGDTVNIASRMESSGEASKINISGVTYDYVKDFFICEYRGKMPVKYKGELDMYFVNGIRPELRVEGRSEPNQRFRNKILLIRIADLEDYLSDMYLESMKDWLKFHDNRHLKNIITQAELIGRAERFSDEEMVVLLLASSFIMTGYVSNYADPFQDSVELMRQIAPDLGFSLASIEEAISVIDDSLKTHPVSKQGKVLNDSIFDHYGRVDCLGKLELLYDEVSVHNEGLNKTEWFREQIVHISAHNFHTPTAQLLRTVSVSEQVAAIEEFISSL